MLNLPKDFQVDYCLSKMTTIGIGGPARFFIEVKHIFEMQQVLAYCFAQTLRFFILGKGSNVLFEDQGFNGLIIGNRINFLEKLTPTEWHVGAGYSFSLLGSQTAKEGLSGLEFASGIPGSVGGAVFMNAGANGEETSSCLKSVDFVDAAGNLLKLNGSELKFGYRMSSFQQMKGAIVGATFELSSSSIARSKQLNLIHYRKNTQPYNEKSAGCAFQNPPQGSAGAIIDEIGLKGERVGGAQISCKHANFLVNLGNASSKDVKNLIKLVKAKVKAEKGIDLKLEIQEIDFN